MSSSAICQNFVQNAWKKELCSNCFKSKDEHSLKKNQSKPIVTLIPNEKVNGIIKNHSNKKPNRTKLHVAFTKELTEFIGYGGEDWLTDYNEESNENEDIKVDSEELYQEVDTSEESDEDFKEICKITRENTDFNTTSLGVDLIEVKKSYTHLLLGKPIVDSEGKKQTLLVSVTPFGEDNNKKSKSNNNNITKSISSQIPIVSKNTNLNNKHSNIADSKTNGVLLTGFCKNTDKATEEKSLLDEISETLENSKNPIQIRKKIEQQIVLSIENKENVAQKENEVILDEPNNKIVTNKNSIIPEKKISLTRTGALIKKDTEKPMVYKTSTAKIELLNIKNLNVKQSPMTRSEVNNNTIEKQNCKILTTNFLLAEIKHSAISIPEEIPHKNNKLTTLPPIIPKYPLNFPQNSREQDGKPDGREDPGSPVSSELPALPLSPPPTLDPQTDFLESQNTPNTNEKPKIPLKPATISIRNKNFVSNTNANVPTPTLTSFTPKEALSKQDSNDSEVRANKRRAPRPPEECVYTRNSSGSINIDSPVVREKEKRERASSCNPKMYIVNSSPAGDGTPVPAPAPRKSLSISSDNLNSKEKNKSRFSLRKFLRMGSSKDLSTKVTVAASSEGFSPRCEVDSNGNEAPQPKPRLVIVHPSELNGAKVEVVPTAKPSDQTDSAYSSNGTSSPNKVSAKSSKPPPPPRNYENWTHKHPPPPKSAEILHKQRQISRSNSNSSANRKIAGGETVYANIGEVRSAIIPNKPVRTASMREREALQQKQMLIGNQRYGYEAVIGMPRRKSSENVYDYVLNNSNSTRSSSPDSDSSKNSPKTMKNGVRLISKRSESSIDVSGAEYYKYSNGGNIPRSMSLTYCGSETESEIYSPYSFYGSESEVTEDDHDYWIQNGKTQKLRSRKGRSIVHKNLEDNYGAVVVANHEALAQVLENIQQTIHIQPALRGLKTSPNLRLTDFSLQSATQPPVVIGNRAFHQSLWNAQHVTLVFSSAAITSSSSTSSLGNFSLNSVTEFNDLAPCEVLLPYSNVKDEATTVKNVQANISVLPWTQVCTIHSYGEILKNRAQQNAEDVTKDAHFVMLQLVNALKVLQAQGIEELPLSLQSFVLCKEMDRDIHHRLCILQGSMSDEKYGTLCMCAAEALAQLQTTTKITPLIQSLLNHERSVSLTQVKSILEFSLWGPSDVSLGSTVRERELALQRWLDLQRATVLHGLVCARVQLTVYEECHLLFLVRSNARMMCDASLLIESNSYAISKHSHTSKA